jgi:pimeloyl-ACP methyl ester carboxylesterase
VGTLAPGLVFDAAPDQGRPTAVFIHGCTGSPSQFAAIAERLRGRANLAAFVYDDRASLARSAEELRAALPASDNRVVVVTHSMGALLPAYLGATDRSSVICGLSAVYLNPLIGGSHFADDIPALRWLQPLKPYIQRAFFPASVRDLTPESEFQQRIFGPNSMAPCFAPKTVIVFTEIAGDEPDVMAERIPLFFGHTREELVARLGQVGLAPAEPAGHDAPLLQSSIALPWIEGALHGRDVKIAATGGSDAKSEESTYPASVRNSGSLLRVHDDSLGAPGR